MMKEVATIRFTEVETSGEALAIVRYDEDAIAICLSMKSNGDMQVVMKKKDAKALLAAMRTAVE